MTRPCIPNTRRRAGIALACSVILAGVARPGAAAPAEDPVQEAKLARLPPGQSVIRDRDPASFAVKNGQSVLRLQVVPVTGMPFREALRIEKLPSPGQGGAEAGPAMDAADTRVGKSTNYVQVESRSLIPVRNGDWVLMTFYGRALRAGDTNQGARLRTVFGFAVPPGSTSIARETRLGPEWQRYYYAFPLMIKNKEDPRNKNLAEAGTQHVLFDLDVPPQTIEIADFRCLDYGPQLHWNDLPQTPVTYAGREPDAPWRKAAEARIEQLRKGDLSVCVTRAGQPVPDAQVTVAMQRHAFGFGTAVVPFRLLHDNTPDGERYRKELLRLFNGGTTESGLLMREWWHNPQEQQDTIAFLNWMLEHGLDVHGHTLVWPAWRKNAKELKALADKPEALRRTLDAHIRQIVTATKGGVDMWLAVNEAWASHDWTDLLGEASLADWFKTAHAADPRARLFINDNRILGASDENMNSPKHQWYEKTVQGLLDAGAPISGIGMQGHCSWDAFMGPETIVKVLDRLSRFKLELAVTEFGFYVSDEDLQGDYVRDYYTALFSEPQVTSIYMWGFWDGQHHAYNAPIFRKDWSLKPSGRAYEDLVLHTWWTNTKGTADHAGVYRTRGFLGDYELQVTSGGKTRTVWTALAHTGTVVTVDLNAPDQPPPAHQRPALVYDPALTGEPPPVGHVAMTGGQARVDFKAPDGVELKPLAVSGAARWAEPTWLEPAQRKTFLVCYADLSPTEWRTFTLRFEPQADGEIDLKLKGQFDKQNAVWVLYDKVAAQGATLANGDFEDGKGKPTGWKLPVAKGAEWVRAKGVAASGAACIKVSQDAYAAQSLTVKKGQEVALTFAAKLAGVTGK